MASAVYSQTTQNKAIQYQSHVHCVSLQEVTIVQWLLTEAIRIQTSLYWHTTTQRPVLSLKDMVALALLPLNICILPQLCLYLVISFNSSRQS